MFDAPDPWIPLWVARKRTRLESHCYGITSQAKNRNVEICFPNSAFVVCVYMYHRHFLSVYRFIFSLSFNGPIWKELLLWWSPIFLFYFMVSVYHFPKKFLPNLNVNFFFIFCLDLLGFTYIYNPFWMNFYIDSKILICFHMDSLSVLFLKWLSSSHWITLVSLPRYLAKSQ